MGQIKTLWGNCCLYLLFAICCMYMSFVSVACIWGFDLDLSFSICRLYLSFVSIACRRAGERKEGRKEGTALRFDSSDPSLKGEANA